MEKQVYFMVWGCKAGDRVTLYLSDSDYLSGPDKLPNLQSCN